MEILANLIPVGMGTILLAPSAPGTDTGGGVTEIITFLNDKNEVNTYHHTFFPPDLVLFCFGLLINDVTLHLCNILLSLQE